MPNKYWINPNINKNMRRKLLYMKKRDKKKKGKIFYWRQHLLYNSS